MLAGLVVASLPPPRTGRAHAAGDWQLILSPAVGNCTGPLTMGGSGFPAGADVLLFRFGGPNDLVPVARTRADDQGRFSVAATDAFPPECAGATVAFGARVVTGEHAGQLEFVSTADGSGQAVAAYEIASPQQLVATPVGAGCEQARLEGRFFDAGQSIVILVGPSGALGDSYAEVGAALTDASGRFERVVDTLHRSPCPPGTQVGFYVRTPESIQRVVYTVGVRAASTGNAGLFGGSSDRGWGPWSLAAATLALVIVARALAITPRDG